MTSSSNEFIAGCVGGMAQVVIGQPFDLVKVRLQAASSAQKMYNSAWDCFRKIVKHEGGSFALWKGTLPPLVGVGAAVSIQFGVNEKTKQFARKAAGVSELGISHLFGCGVVAGIATSLISTPVEHTRIRMQVQGKNSFNALECVKRIVKSYGIRGLYKGNVPTLCRDGVAFGIYFSMYEWITKKIIGPDQSQRDLSVGSVVFAGGLAGITLWIATFPVDMIKTKIQADSLQNPTFKGMYDCFAKTYQNGGLKGFYKGLTPCLLRAVPANGATFLAYETASKLLTSKEDLLRKFTFA
jgi:solute carrier family 25 carnitine/acylcarnitine transporter 20/29